MPDYNSIQQKKKNFKSKFIESPSTQIEMPLKYSFMNRFFLWKKKITQVEDRMKFSLFLRNFFIWLTIFIALSTTIISCGYLLHVWNQIPQKVPIYSMFNSSKDKLVNKQYLWFIAFIPLILEIFSMIIFFNIFKSYEKLKFLILQIIFIVSILSILGIYSLVRLY